MKANSWHHKLFHFHLSFFEYGQCGKEEKKIQKFELVKNEKSFLDIIKDIFYSF